MQRQWRRLNGSSLWSIGIGHERRHPAACLAGRLLPARRFAGVIHTSGTTSRRGGVLQVLEPVRQDVPVEEYRAAVELACANALSAARGVLAEGERLAGVLSMMVYVAAEPGFEVHSRLADFASALLRREMGDAGIGARAAVGVANLLGNAPVEIQIVAHV